MAVADGPGETVGAPRSDGRAAAWCHSCQAAALPSSCAGGTPSASRQSPIPYSKSRLCSPQRLRVPSSAASDRRAGPPPGRVHLRGADDAARVGQPYRAPRLPGPGESRSALAEPGRPPVSSAEPNTICWVRLPPGVAISFVLLGTSSVAFIFILLQRTHSKRCVRSETVATIFRLLPALIAIMRNESIEGFLNAT